MLSHVLSRESIRQVLWRVGAAMLLALLAAVFTTRTSQAAPLAQAIEPCIQPGSATIIDPVGGAIQVRMFDGPTSSILENYPTSIQRIELVGGQVVYGFCIASTEARLTGVTVCLLSEISNVRLAYLIAKYPPDLQNRINQAARQAAVWHFSNGIVLDMANPTTEGPAVDAAVASAYTALLAEINAINPDNPPAILTPGPLAMSVDPVAAINQLPTEPGHPFTVTLSKGGLPLPGIQVQVASNFGLFDQTTATTDAKGEATFTISSNVAGTANITATAVVTVPRSLEYVVREDPIAVQPFGIPSSTVETITATASKEWRNAPPPPPGRITLTKNVQGTATGEQWAFNFTLDGGSLRIATNAAPQVTWEDLVPGRTYILSEADPGSAWTAGTFACFINGAPVGAVGANGFEIPVTAGADITCSITNTKVPPGQIRLTKRVVGTDEDWSFTFRLAGAALPNERVVTKAVPTASWSNLTPNLTYTLSEDNPGADWVAGGIGCFVNGTFLGDADPGTSGYQILVQPGAVIDCAADNTKVPPPPDTGTITLTKQVFGTTEDWTFNFTLNGGNPRTATQAAPTVVWANLVPNQIYTLAEVSPGAAWSVGGFVCSVNGTLMGDASPDLGFQILVTPNAQVECGIDNTKLPPPPEPGAITVTKLVSGTTENWAFTFTLDGANERTATKVAPTVTWTGLEPDRTYTLTEVPPGSGWSAGGFSCAIGGDPIVDLEPETAGFQIRVTSGAAITCTITNTRMPPPPPGSITLTKVITVTRENNWAFAFQLTTLDGGNPQSRVVSKGAATTVWNNLTPGVTYRLSEQVPGAPWVEGDFSCTLDDQPVGVVEPNGPITLTVNAGDDIICRKDNVDLSGTDLDEGEEPAITGMRLFLPMLTH